jgi:hypothetical protein
MAIDAKLMPHWLRIQSAGGAPQNHTRKFLISVEFESGMVREENKRSPGRSAECAAFLSAFYSLLTSKNETQPVTY